MFSSISGSKLTKLRSENIPGKFNVTRLYYQRDYWCVLSINHGFEILTYNNESLAFVNEREISHLTFVGHDIIICHITHGWPKVHEVNVEERTVNFTRIDKFFQHHIWSPNTNFHMGTETFVEDGRTTLMDIITYYPCMNYSSFCFTFGNGDPSSYYDTWSGTIKRIPAPSQIYDFITNYDPDLHLLQTVNTQTVDQRNINIWDTRYMRQPLYIAPEDCRHACLFHGKLIMQSIYVSYFDIIQHTLQENYLSYHLNFDFNPFEPSISTYTGYGNGLRREVHGF